VKPQFPKRRGAHDNAPTPQALYDIIVNRLGFIDVCQDPKRFDATASTWPNRPIVTLRSGIRGRSFGRP